MGKRERRRVVFLLFEGPSDFNALYIPVARMFEAIDESIEVVYGFVEDTNQEKGDITTKFGVNPDTIQDVMNKIVFKPALDREGLYPKDLLRIIQFVDMDGAYVADDMIVCDPNCTKTRYEEKILTDNPLKIVDRNQRKRANLDFLTSLSDLKVSSKTIPYEVYFLSTNLEHVISNDSNYEGSKNENAKTFYQDNASSTSKFASYFGAVLPEIKDATYDQTWRYIKENNNSLQRCSNIGVLIYQLQLQSES